jgi:4-hydroxyphenylacetate 3-monooxygenase
MTQTSGLAARFKDFAAQCLAEYDLEGWKAPDLIAADDVKLFGQKPRPTD